MASTWDPGDFLSPNGLLKVEMFPKEEDLSSRIQKAIDEGDLKAVALTGDNLENAVQNWVYHTLFLQAFVDYNMDPTTSVLADQGSESFTEKQIENWKVLSDEYLAKFNNLVATVGNTFLGIPRSQSVPNTPVW